MPDVPNIFFFFFLGGGGGGEQWMLGPSLRIKKKRVPPLNKSTSISEEFSLFNRISAG